VGFRGTHGPTNCGMLAAASSGRCRAAIFRLKFKFFLLPNKVQPFGESSEALLLVACHLFFLRLVAAATPCLISVSQIPLRSPRGISAGTFARLHQASAKTAERPVQDSEILASKISDESGKQLLAGSAEILKRPGSRSAHEECAGFKPLVARDLQIFLRIQNHLSLLCRRAAAAPGAVCRLFLYREAGTARGLA